MNSIECVAISTGRPLLALIVADIGIKEDVIGTELSPWFYLAERWKAVLVIDEADIFLKRHKHTDLTHNGIVSGMFKTKSTNQNQNTLTVIEIFLRKMEYFQSLLFLTTNRVRQIDEAFTSRVHVVIEYPPLGNERRH